MSDGISEDVPGLFGWVPAQQRGQGRPPYVWTREKSNKVMVLFASGYKPKDAAAVLGCDLKTFRKVFSLECKSQATAELILRSGMMARLIDEIEQGNVGAVRQLDKMLQAERVRTTSSQITSRGRSEPKAVPLGKKEAAKEAAKALGGKFGTRPPPALLQ